MANGGQGISPGGFLAVLWTLSSVATLLLVGRFLVRKVIMHRLNPDDIFMLLAWILMIVSMIVATLMNPISYQFTSILVGEAPKPSEDELIDMTITLRRWAVSAQFLFWTTIYCVKLSFTFLYRPIFNSKPKYRRAWLVAVVYIIITYGICLMGVFGQCGDARNLFRYEECMTPYVASFTSRAIWVVYFFNVTSDLVLVFLPLPSIWRPGNLITSQKLALTGICSLALITIAFETVRTVKLYQLNFSLTNLYGYLELLVAVIVGMIPGYRFLLTNNKDKNTEYRRLFWSRVTLRRREGDKTQTGYSLETINR
ncbi:hypothetical protein QBC38DRAFT_493741 [Podospora fimiseda]|uniref:Rhodopsin domain-containing protein n=1 Tax=Podospora fimiseda TaxID=252190 RepID=A0AAN6YLE4_9PEZI|nr:hypothetical protein QBC38DRAFT_493741 [Podospora fimiseda]